MESINAKKVSDDEKYAITRTGLPNCYRVVIRYGYAEEGMSKELGKLVYTHLRNYIVTELLPDGRSSAIIHPSQDINPRVENTLLHRGGSKSGSKEEGVNNIEKQVEKAADSSGSTTSATVPTTTDDSGHSIKPPAVDMNERDRRLHALDEAYNQQVLYIIGKAELQIPQKMNIFKRVFMSAFLYLRDLTNEKASNWRLPHDKLVEVGFIREL
jgi:KUP system potassium uptake protein